MKRDGMPLWEYRALVAEKKAKAAAKGKALGLRKPKRRKVNSRRAAFARLKELCKTFTLLRAKDRTGGMCEVALKCFGAEPAVLAYHIFPAATGNGAKYDPRNLLGSCARDNGAEYFARKRGAYSIWDRRHKEILGEALWFELKDRATRRQISTVEAREMADKLKAMIETNDWKAVECRAVFQGEDPT